MNPNSVNNFFGIKVSKPGVNVSNAADADLVLKDDYTTRTYYDQAGNPRILIGKLPDGTYGMQVSAPGQDVTTASSPQQFTFNSNFSSIISPLFGTITIPGLPTQAAFSSGTQGATPIAHGLDYTPSMIGFYTANLEIGTGVSKIMNVPANGGLFQDNNLVTNQVFIGTDATNLYAYNFWSMTSSAPVAEFVIQYYLLNVTA